MDYLKLINLYVGRSVDFSEFRLVDHSDGNGIQIEFWNIADKPQPTMAELEALQSTLEKQVRKSELQAQIDEIDKKRIRAIAEPVLKDGGKTWLEYYTEQIQELRAQILEL